MLPNGLAEVTNSTTVPAGRIVHVGGDCVSELPDQTVPAAIASL